MSETQSTDGQTSQVPWLSLVQHHREIVRRGEEHFFRLSGDGIETDTWSRLDGFEPVDLAGPWELPAEQISSQRFVASARRGLQADVFLGGPCVLTTNDKKETFAQPLLYRPVTIDFDADPVTVTPTGGRWAFSHLIRRFLERNEISEDPSELLDALLDTVSRKTADTDCHSAILRALAGLVPQAPDLLNPAPMRWVLFSPPHGVSAVLQHLYTDFKRLDLRLQKHPEQIGGLRLLEPGQNLEPPEAGADLRAFVPLNDSQKRAVVGALDARPVTVVSGPPGCGKSQVVVALMLHAWARGITVLFASNNNKAVEVVRERLQRIESEFPVVVRAGIMQHNDIDETLDRVLRMRGGRASNRKMQAERVAELKQQRAQLQAELDSGTPERAHQLRMACLSALAEARRLQEEVDRRDEAVREKYPSAGDDWPPEQGRTLLERLQEWQKSAANTRRQISNDATRRATLEAALTHAQARRQASAAVAGLAIGPGDACDWLLQSPYTPELLDTSWRALRDSLGRPLERDLEPVAWYPQYDAWSGEAEAREASARANQIAGEMQSTLVGLVPLVARMRALNATIERLERALSACGLGRESLRAEEALSQWAEAYARYWSMPPSGLDLLPWRPRPRAARAMTAAEERLRGILPVKFWKELGPLDDDGRRKLADVATLVEEYAHVRRTADSAADEHASVRQQSLTLRMRAAQVGLTISSELASEAWSSHVDELRRMARVAADAAKAWEARTRCEAAREEIRSRAVAVRGCLRSDPFTSSWCSGPGLYLDDALGSVEVEQSSDTVERLRLVTATHGCQPLIEAWTDARRAEGDLRAALAELTKVATPEARLRAWWEERPRTPRFEHAPASVPPDDNPFWAPLSELTAWVTELTAWSSIDRPRLQRAREAELETCRQSLERALAQLSTHASLPMDARRTHPFDWDLEALGNRFEEVTPERIRGRLVEMDDELEKLEFDEAKASWQRRVASDRAALGAVDELRTIYRQWRTPPRKQDDYDRFCDRFKTALAAVPVWVTTAQSTQHIPMRPDLFDIVVIDEATQCTLTNLLPLIYRGKRLVVLGDENQLPAIPSIDHAEEREIASRHGIAEWLSRFGHAGNDVFATAQKVLPGRSADVLQLDEHYRSHVQIIAFSNQHIYHRSLHLKVQENRRFEPDAGLHMVDTRGRVSRFRSSWRNHREAEQVTRLIADIRSRTQVPIGVVTPFAGQASLIMETLERQSLAADVVVGTAHKFQGDERPVVIFSTVASNEMPLASVRWIEKPPNLVNVAVTRAQSALYVVSDFEFCERAGAEGILGKLARYCRRVDELRRTSPAELELFNWMLVDGLDPETHVIVGDIEVDFVLRGRGGLKLVVEVDGKQHARQKGTDESRDVFLQSHGYKVMRVTAREAQQTPYDVVSDVRAVLGGKAVPERYRGSRDLPREALLDGLDAVAEGLGLDLDAAP